jgi:hypothetical protein
MSCPRSVGEIGHPSDVPHRALDRALKVSERNTADVWSKMMHPEIEFELMKNHADELRRAAAEHRRVREAQRGNKSERRSLFGKRRSS